MIIFKIYDGNCLRLRDQMIKYCKTEREQERIHYAAFRYDDIVKYYRTKMEHNPAHWTPKLNEGPQMDSTSSPILQRL
jgi:hypothetical protein